MLGHGQEAVFWLTFSISNSSLLSRIAANEGPAPIIRLIISAIALQFLILAGCTLEVRDASPPPTPAHTPLAAASTTPSVTKPVSTPNQPPATATGVPTRTPTSASAFAGSDISSSPKASPTPKPTHNPIPPKPVPETHTGAHRCPTVFEPHARDAALGAPEIRGSFWRCPVPRR